MFSPDISTQDAAAFLAHRFSEVEAVELLATGEWSRAFAFRRAGQALVIRFSRWTDDFAKDAAAHRFATPALPIPPIVELGEAFEGAYAIAPRMPGRSFDTLTTAEYRATLPALFRMLDAMRAADVSTSRGYGAWRAGDLAAPAPTWRAALLAVTEGHVDDRIAGWQEKMATAPGAGAAFEDGCRALESLVDACPDSRHLIHADLLSNNVLLDGDRITAVLDWGNAMYGDFLYDLARLTFWQPWHPELARVDLVAAAEAHYRDAESPVTDLRARLRCYQVHIGLDAQAYNAFTDRWDELERSARRTLQLASAR